MRKICPASFAVLPGVVLAQTASGPLPQADGGLVQVLLGLGAVIVAIVGALWLLKRLSAAHGAGGGALRVIAGTALGPRERVVLLEVADTWLVVGVAPGQVSALHRMPKGALATTAGDGRETFGAWLNRFMERGRAH
jgi:flagellar protein FliO/FliZ